ncbi:energy-coupling factor ABC transporter permease [candidate division KSB1 bacterium]
MKNNNKIIFVLSLLLLLFIGSEPIYAVHVSDGILEFKFCILYFIIVLPFLYTGVKQINKKRHIDPNYIPLVAMIGALVLILSSFHIPVPGLGSGSSSHPTGTAIEAILIGAFPATVLVFTTLILHAVFLAHGGITTLGANTFSMGIIGAFIGVFLFKILYKKINIFWAAAIAAFISDIATYITTSIQLSTALHGDVSYLASFFVILAGYMPTQIPLATVDAFIAGIVIKQVAIKQPELLSISVNISKN